MAARREHVDAIEAVVAGWMKRHTADELVARLEAEGVPCAKVATIAEVAASEQLRHRDGIVEIDMAGQKVPMQGVTIHLSDTPLAVRSPIPAVGAHSAEVLRGWLGYEPARIDRLKTRGVI
jgi:crotonobetainyl-CoA:carnitine CoA-transferase CaiB-like acyl-CoA transferase